MKSVDEREIRVSLLNYLVAGEIENGILFFKKFSDDVSKLFRLECLGNISFYQRNINEAISFYEAATLISPGHEIPRYLYLAGVKNEREGNFVDAFRYYQAAIESEPSFIDPYVELGGLLTKAGDFQSALRCYEDAVLINDKDPLNHENLKIILMKLAEGNPEAYAEKIESAKVAYQKLTQDEKTVFSTEKHHW